MSCFAHSARAVRLRALVLCVALAMASGLAATTHADAGTDPAETASTLDRIVVTASGFEQVVREAPASISVIERATLERKSFHGIAEALAEIEGVDIDLAWDKTGAPSISIRGMPSDYTLLLVDGRRQNPAGNVAPNGFGATQNNFIPPMSAIERIEVIRGPMSTLYGSDAMGGVVNIITRRPGDRWGGTAGVDTTVQQDSRFGDARSGNIYLAGPIARDRLMLSLWGGAYARDASDIRYEALDGDEVVPWMGANPVAYDNFNIGSRLTVRPSDTHELWLEAVRNRQKYDNSEGEVGTLGSGGYEPVQRYERDQATLAWNAQLGFGALESTLMDSRTETIGRLIPAGVAGAGTPRQLRNDNTVFDTKLVTSLGENMLSVGGQWWDAGMVDGATPAPFEFRQWAVFAENEWRMHERLGLTLGARRDDHSTFGGQTSPRAYLVFDAHEHWVVKGGVSRGFKTPRLEQLSEGINGYGRQGQLPLIGTPTLTPETSTSSELAVYYAHPTGVAASLGVFHNDFDDKIASGTPVPNCTHAAAPNRPGCVDVGDWPAIEEFGQSINIDRAVTRGAELTMRFPLASAWTLSGNYTLTDSEQKSGDAAGEPLVNSPRHMLNASLGWRFDDRLDLSLRAQYRSSRYRGAGPAQDQLGDYKPYTVFHLAARWQHSEALGFNVSLQNLFDKQFVDYVPYVSDPGTGALGYTSTRLNNEDGRRLWLSMNYSF